MKRIIILSAFFLPLFLAGQQAIIIDHSCLDPGEIPAEFIESAKENIWIGYGHSSHGSQLISGMDALDGYFTDGTYAWSHDGGPGELHLFEGDGWTGSSGYLRWDLGHGLWPDETRTYLNDHPECNVIIWSWCDQVDDVDLPSHYFGPMEQLELDYPDVHFVYMTGHLEGEGTGGSLNLANEQIRNFCLANNKILFDFADIERYDPDSEQNYQDYFANDACDYTLPGGGTANWANNWLAANPGHELTQISQLCSSCAHSVSLNCTKKGIASWYLWSRLAGWEGPAAVNEKKNPIISNRFKIYPNPANNKINIEFNKAVFCNTLEIWDQGGRQVYSKLINESHKQIFMPDINMSSGIYLVRIVSGKQLYTAKFYFYK